MTKAIVSRVTEAGSTPRRGEQRRDPGPRRRPQPLEAEPGDRAVLAEDRRDVGHRPDRRQVGQLGDRGDRRDARDPLEQQRRHLERDAAAREASIRVGGVRSVRVHEGERRGRDLGDAVVVRDDHVDPGEPGRRHLGDAGRARVDGEQEGAAALAGRLHGLQREPVALVDAARHVRGHVEPQPAERRHEDREARQAVGVEVAHHQHALAALAGPCHARHDDGRIREQGRHRGGPGPAARSRRPRRRPRRRAGRGPWRRATSPRAPPPPPGTPRRAAFGPGSATGSAESASAQHGTGRLPVTSRAPGRRLARGDVGGTAPHGAGRRCGGSHAEARRTGRPGVARSLRRASHSSQTVRSGAALKIEEYVPEMIPIRRARMNGRIESPPNRKSARQGQGHDEARVDRAGQRLQDRMVDDAAEALAGMAGAVLTDPVVDHDRVVDREADDRQHRGDEEAVDLEPEERPEDRERADDHDHVVDAAPRARSPRTGSRGSGRSSRAGSRSSR